VGVSGKLSWEELAKGLGALAPGCHIGKGGKRGRRTEAEASKLER
jgi:hypothetical protein